ncbi:EAL domain-containing protein [Gallaecimonas sp. GXIMD4217]|uniref:EAL domain-containing protein n=1 Tax=Gallaecimonas sp. GXIMD4217 TaxID=3131927 RepID=UPI00311B3D86
MSTESLLQHLHCPLGWLDKDAQLVGWNPAFAKLFDGAPDTFWSQSELSADWRQRLPGQWQDQLPGAGLVQVHATALPGGEGSLLSVRPLVDDGHCVLDLLSHPIFIQSPEGALLACNQAFAALLGRERQALIGLGHDQLFSQPWGQALAEQRRQLLDSGQAHQYQQQLDGQPVLIRQRPLASGERLLAVVGEFWEQPQAVVGEFWELPQVANRDALLSHLEEQILIAKRTKMPLGLMLIDLCNFQQINDDYGLQLGDRLLRVVAERLGSGVRETDMVARLEGDRFAVVASHLQDKAAMAQVLTKVSALFESPFLLDDQKIRLNFRTGIAVYPEDAEEGPPLFNNAELALHNIKKEGGEIRFYDDKIDVMVRKTRELGKDLGRALEDNQFALRFQPVVSAYGNKLIGVETLLRWNHPVHGELQPQEFIYIAESVGLINEVGNHVLDMLKAQLERWQDYGIFNINLSLNVSPAQLRHGDLYDRLKVIVDELGGPDQFTLELELNESAIYADGQRYTQQLLDLKKLGIRLTIDEFGSVNGALNNLTKLPIDTLKIDRHYVAKLTKDRDADTLVRAIIKLGKELGIRTSAVGVESLDQLNFLRNERCEQVQGFAVSTPIEGEDFITWYHNFNLVRGGIQP